MTGNPDISILLTRPTTQSARFADDLRPMLGPDVPVIISPLLEIVPQPGKIDLADISHLLFTSANGVRGFCDQCTRRDLPAVCVGTKTATAARRAGVPVVSTAPTSGALLARLTASGAENARYLYLRGEHAAWPIVETLRNHAIQAREVVVYEQRAVPLGAAALDALNDAARLVLPLFSPRTARLFQAAAGDLALDHVIAICLSENVAAGLEKDRYQQVIVASSPDAVAVAREIAAVI